MSFSGLVDQQLCYVLLMKYCASAMTQPSHHRWFCVRPEWWRTVGTFTQHCEFLMPSSVEVVLVTVTFHFSCFWEFGVGGRRTGRGIYNLSVQFSSVQEEKEVFHVPWNFLSLVSCYSFPRFLLISVAIVSSVIFPPCPTPVNFFPFQSVNGITKTGSSMKTPRQPVSRLKDRSYTIWVSWSCAKPYRTALKL